MEAADPTPTATASAEAAAPPANPSPTATATAVPPADPPPAPTLITVATGDEGVLLLEWTPSTETLFPNRGVTGWQYRQQYDPPGDGVLEPREDRWEAWADVPGSTAATRSYRLMGLQWRGAYYFQVRAVAESVEGEPTEAVEGSPSFVDEHGLPTMELFQIAEGGRTWRLTHDCPTVFDVPTGTRLMLLAGSVSDDGCWTYRIRDVETGSEVRVDPNDGTFLRRKIVQTEEGVGGKGVGGESGRDVDAIFDRIEASARLVEPPVFD